MPVYNTIAVLVFRVKSVYLRFLQGVLDLLVSETVIIGTCFFQITYASLEKRWHVYLDHDVASWLFYLLMTLCSLQFRRREARPYLHGVESVKRTHILRRGSNAFICSAYIGCQTLFYT